MLRLITITLMRSSVSTYNKESAAKTSMQLASYTVLWDVLLDMYIMSKKAMLGKVNVGYSSIAFWLLA